jgi:glycosyl transferase, family 9
MKIFENLMKFYLRNRKTQKCEMVSEKFKCVCFFSNTAIGDTLFNTPVFREFRAKFSDVKTIALLNPNNAALFRDDPNLDEIITYDGRWGGFLKTLKILKSKKIDICFLLHSNEPQATPLAILSGAKYVFKLPNHKNKFNFLHSNTPQKYADESRYIVLNRLLQLKFVGINSDESLAKDEICRLSLYLNPADYVRVDEKLKNLNGEYVNLDKQEKRQTNINRNTQEEKSNKQANFKQILSRDKEQKLAKNDPEICSVDERKIIGFQMGASSRSRKWTLQRWCELALMILQHTNYQIVLTGSPSERDECDLFIRELEKNLDEFLSFKAQEKRLKFANQANLNSLCDDENFAEGSYGKAVANSSLEFDKKISQNVSNIANLKSDLLGRVLNLAGVFNLREAAALIDRLNILITPDTGPLHVAAAMKTPTIALYGVADPNSSNPNFDTKIHKIIKADFKNYKGFDKHDDCAQTMEKISSQSVYELMGEILKENL